MTATFSAFPALPFWRIIALENIFYNGEDVEAALQNAEDACNEELASSEFVPVESSYAHADEAK